MTFHEPTTVTVLGTGAIGTAVATALLRSGRRVTVWNRTPERTGAAHGAGALVADDLASAVSGADLVLVCLTDHEAVRDLLPRLPVGPRTLAVLTTGTPEDAVRAEALADAHAMTYLDVGVQTAPEDIGTERATFLYAGPRAALEEHRGTLEALGPVRWVGADPQAAALWDLVLFGLWYDAQLGLLRALDAVAGAGVPLADFAEAAGRQLSHVVAGAADTAEEVASDQHPRGPASLAEHLPVLQRLTVLREGARLGDGGIGKVADRVAEAVAAAGGDAGLTALLARGSRS